MCGANDPGVDQIADPRARDDSAGQTLLPESRVRSLGGRRTGGSPSRRRTFPHARLCTTAAIGTSANSPRRSTPFNRNCRSPANYPRSDAARPCRPLPIPARIVSKRSAGKGESHRAATGTRRVSRERRDSAIEHSGLWSIQPGDDRRRIRHPPSTSPLPAHRPGPASTPRRWVASYCANTPVSVEHDRRAGCVGETPVFATPCNRSSARVSALDRSLRALRVAAGCTCPAQR